MTVEAMLYRIRTGCPWRDLPQAFGCWNRIYKRFNAWSAAGKWIEIFKASWLNLTWSGLLSCLASVSGGERRFPPDGGVCRDAYL
jgi:hypothetical protein